MYFWIHLVVAVLLTVLFLVQFIRQKQIYQLLFVIWVPTTLLTYVPAIGQNSTLRLILGGFQLLMFILVIFFMFRRDPKKIAAARAALKEELEDTAPRDGEPSAPQESGGETPAEAPEPKE